MHLTKPENNLAPGGGGSSAFGYLGASVMALLLLPFLYAAFFTYPAGDDFARAIKAGHIFDLFGGVHEMARAWWKWSGRYTHHFLVVFLGDAAGSRAGYTLMTLGSFFFFWLCLYGIFKEMGGKNSRAQAFFFATFGLLASLCTHGGLNLWYSITNQLAVGAGQSVTLLYIWSLLKLWNAPVVTRGVKWFCLLSCIAAAGCYEYSAPLVLLCSLAAWAMAFLYRHPHTRTFGLLFKVSAVCFVLSYFARGNFRRNSKRGTTGDVVGEQLADLPQVLSDYVLPASVNPLFPLLLLGAIAFVPSWRMPLAKVLALPAVLMTGLLCMAGFVGTQVLVHAVSDHPITASSKVPELLVQYTSIIAAFCFFSLSSKKPLPLLMKAAVFFAMLFFIVTTPNFQTTLGNVLSGQFLLLEKEMDARAGVMREHGKEELTVAPLLALPYPSRVSDPISSKGFGAWPNKYAAEFYGLAKVAAAQQPDARPVWRNVQNGVPVIWTPVGDGVSAAFVPAPPDGSGVFGGTSGPSWVFIKGLRKEAATVHITALPPKAPLLEIRAAMPGSWALWMEQKGDVEDVILAFVPSKRPLQAVFPHPGDSVEQNPDDLVHAAPVSLIPSPSGEPRGRIYLSIDGAGWVNILPDGDAAN